MLKFVFSNNIIHRHVFSNNLQRAYFATAARNFGVSMIAIFEPLYLIKILRNHGVAHEITLVLLYFGVIFLFYGLLCPLGARLASRYGLKTVILVSAPFLFAYYTALLYASHAPLFIIVALVVQIINKTLYWPAFHFFFAKSGSDDHRGREVSGSLMIGGVAAMIGPPLGGLIISVFGFPALFATVLLVSTLMAVPFLFIEEVRPDYHGNLLTEFKNVLSKDSRNNSIAFAARGIEDTTNGVFWPIFLFLQATSFFAIGLIMFAATAVILTATFLIGQISDKVDKRLILRGGVIITSLVWFSRMFIKTPFQALTTNLFYGFGITTVAVPFASIFYGAVAKEGQNPYHAVIVREVARNLSITVFMVICALILPLIPNIGVLFPAVSLITLFISKI